MDCKIRKFEDWKRYCSQGVHVFIVKLTSTVKLTSLLNVRVRDTTIYWTQNTTD